MKERNGTDNDILCYALHQWGFLWAKTILCLGKFRLTEHRPTTSGRASLSEPDKEFGLKCNRIFKQPFLLEVFRFMQILSTCE